MIVEPESPLEQFLREYVEVSGGLWEEREPRVYDVLWPDADQTQRLTFDPEALPEHPSARLLTFGLPPLDELLAQAQARSPATLAYLDDLHLHPHGLAQRIQRELTPPEGLAWEIGQIRPRYVSHCVFWLAATFTAGDEQAQEHYTAAIDRLYGRLVRHLDPLLDSSRLAEARRWPYPDAPGIPLAQAYQIARASVVRGVAAEANSRQHDWEARQAQQIERVERYFADMRAELHERIRRAAAREEDTEDLRRRAAAIEREATLRIEELRRKAGARASVRLTHMLEVRIPRLFVEARLVAARKTHAAPPPLTATWDPLVEKTDALDCPNCRRPTYALTLRAGSALGCPACAETRSR